MKKKTIPPEARPLEKLTKAELVRECKKLQVMALQSKKAADSGIREKLEDFYEFLCRSKLYPSAAPFGVLYEHYLADDEFDSENECSHCGRSCDC